MTEPVKGGGENHIVSDLHAANEHVPSPPELLCTVEMDRSPHLKLCGKELGIPCTISAFQYLNYSQCLRDEYSS